MCSVTGAVGDDHGRCGVVQDVADSFGGVCGVDRDVRRPDPGDGDERDHQIRTAGQHHRHPMPDRHITGEEHRGRRVDAGVQFFVGQGCSVLVRHGYRVGCCANLIAYQRVERRARGGYLETHGIGTGRPGLDPTQFVLGNSVHRRDARVGCCCQSVEYAREGQDEAVDRRAREQIRRIGDIARHAGRSVLEVDLEIRLRRSQRCRVFARGLGKCDQSRKAEEFRLGGIGHCVCQQHLEHRGSARVSRCVHCTGDLLERCALMRESVQYHPMGVGEHLAECPAR